MGQFSWIYADKVEKYKKKGRVEGTYMPDNRYKDSYLLIPKPFQTEYGKYIKTTCYDGYGIIGRYDVYELVAIFNKEHLSINMLMDVTHGLENLEREYQIQNIKNYTDTIESLLKFRYTGEITTFKEIRNIGIAIACYDEQNKRLPYPIKITSKPFDYDEVGPSLSDPGQGWDED